MISTCQGMTTITEILKAEVLANPTLAVRTLLHQSNIFARIGGNSLDIWPCQYLNDSQYTFMPAESNETCVRGIPIKVALYGKVHNGYMDPLTNIITKRKELTDCQLARTIPFSMKEKNFEYNPSTGTISELTNLPTIDLFKWNVSSPLQLQPTIFHQIVMFNWSDLNTAISLNDVFSSLSQHNEMLGFLSNSDFAGPSSEGLSSNSLQAPSLVSMLIGVKFNWLQIWGVVVCTYVTIFAFILHCCPCAGQQASKLNLCRFCQHVFQKIQGISFSNIHETPTRVKRRVPSIWNPDTAQNFPEAQSFIQPSFINSAKVASASVSLNPNLTPQYKLCTDQPSRSVEIEPQKVKFQRNIHKK